MTSALAQVTDLCRIKE